MNQSNHIDAVKCQISNLYFNFFIYKWNVTYFSFSHTFSNLVNYTRKHNEMPHFLRVREDEIRNSSVLHQKNKHIFQFLKFLIIYQTVLPESFLNYFL